MLAVNSPPLFSLQIWRQTTTIISKFKESGFGVAKSNLSSENNFLLLSKSCNWFSMLFDSIMFYVVCSLQGRPREPVQLSTMRSSVAGRASSQGIGRLVSWHKRLAVQSHRYGPGTSSDIYKTWPRKIRPSVATDGAARLHHAVNATRRAPSEFPEPRFAR